MKTLLLLRHAKSDWNDDRLDDHERPLAPRGRRACKRMGAWIARSKQPPGLALCSSARRAVDTLDRILPCLETPPRVRIDPALYLASPAAMLAAIANVEDAIEAMLLVGHNPGIHALAVQLAGAGDAGELKRLARKFPTAALAVLRFPVGSWGEIDAGAGELLHFVTPRELAS